MPAKSVFIAHGLSSSSAHVRYNLKEVDVTVQRLKEQLRKMDMESEAQMTSRYQNASARRHTEFDPLELDRFSNMQQLSRALTESVSDLLNLHEMLDDSVPPGRKPAHSTVPRQLGNAGRPDADPHDAVWQCCTTSAPGSPARRPPKPGK